MKILIETSARHIHLSKHDFDILFGKNTALTIKKELSQPGQFVCNERVDLIGARNEIKSVALLGPFREQTQVEVSLTDAMRLGIDAPIRDSGDLSSTPGCVLVGPEGRLDLSMGVIVARRHIHLDPQNAITLNVKNNQIVSVKVLSKLRSLVFEEVKIYVSESFYPAMHIDTDEANAAGIGAFSTGEVILPY